MDSDKMAEPVLRLGQQASPPFMMVSPGCNFTPDEVGRMLANRVVQPHYATWLVRKALECHGAQVSELQAEANEQARLNGMGAEREARLMAQVAGLRAERDALAKDAGRYRWLQDGGLYRVGFDSTGAVSLSVLDSAIDAAMAEGER